MTTKTAKDFKGKRIEEVWNFRLSHGHPVLFTSGKYWRIKVFATDPHNEAWNDHPGKEIIHGKDKEGNLTQNVRVVLEDIETDIPVPPMAGLSRAEKDAIIIEGQRQCYPYLYQLRDKYSRSSIELRKPVVKMIADTNDQIALMEAEVNRFALSAKSAIEDDDDDAKAGELLAAAKAKKAEAQAFLATRNAEIKNAIVLMRQAMAEQEG